MKIGTRLAKPADLPYVKRLARDSVLYTISYARTTSNSVVQARIQEALRGIEGIEGVRILIAFDEDSKRPIGYLILQLDDLDVTTGDSQSYIYDLAVEESYWGSPAVKLLVQEAARLTAKAGLSYMSGEVSAHNERTYLQALRLGFELERMRIVIACGEDGPEPMPKRQEEERTYAASRAGKSGLLGGGLPKSYREVRAFRAKLK